MKKLLLILLIFPLVLHGQIFHDASSEFFVFGNIDEYNKTAIVFGDVCNIRNKPEASGQVIGKLTIGTRLNILSVTKETFTLNGITAPWCKIKYNNVDGYVWAGVLTNNLAKLSDGKSIVWGVIEMKHHADAEIKRKLAKVSLRIFHEGAIITKTDFWVDEMASNPSYGQIDVSYYPILTNVTDIISFHTPAEACMEFSSTNYYLYAGGKMIFVGTGTSVSDADVFASSTYYKFPFKGRDQCEKYIPNDNTYMLIREDWEKDDSCDAVETIKIKTFNWDGTKFKKQGCDE